MYIYESICIFAESQHIFTGVVEHHACAGVYVRQMLWTSAYTFASRLRQDVHMHYIYTCICICICICIYIYLYIACMCSLFHLALGNEDGGVRLVYDSARCLAWGVIFDRRKDRGVVSVFSIFNAGWSVCGCVRVYAHTHTAQKGYLDVSPGVAWRVGSS